MSDATSVVADSELEKPENVSPSASNNATFPRALTPAELKARNKRSLWIALAVAGFAVLIFLVTIARLKSGMS